MHAVRCILARVTDAGWSLRCVWERFLEGACTIVRHARQVVYRIARSKTATHDHRGGGGLNAGRPPLRTVTTSKR